ncbi:MAG: hypothetical protein HY318_09985 [Armatimonadetes bacterium]|nr:hypothetical protein [Armatimonadota bacterium]
MIFRDVKVGMSMATADNGQAENEVLRCQFLRCSEVGLRTNNFNSLDLWAWYCRFEDCGYGLYNGAGNFHAYQNLFLRSKKADIGTANLMVFSFINNTSIGSNCFMDFSGGHTWGSPCSVTGNRILEPTGDWAIRLSNGGPYLVMDNIIKARTDATKPVVEMTWGDQVFVSNTYTVQNPVKETGKFRRIDEKVVDPGTISIAEPKLPPTPPRRQRRVFEVAAGTDAAAIQAAITAAAKLKGQRPVIHLPKGNYNIKTTLLIPAGCDVQLIGDGAAETATVLQWAGEPGGLVMKLDGPSAATVRDLAIYAPQGNGILIERCDQPGGKVFGDQVNLSGFGEAQKPIGLLVNGVENCDVLMRCLQGAAFTTKWVKVVGGQQLQSGKPTRGQVSLYCGATGTSDAQYTVEKGGRLVVRSVYHEMSGDAPQGILLNNSGSLTIDATRFSYKTAPDKPLIKTEAFKGDLMLATSLLLPVNSSHTARIETTGDGSKTNLLCMGNLFWVNELGVDSDKVWLNRANPPASAAMLRCNVNSGVQGATKHGGFDFLDDRGEADDAFILKMLKPLLDARIWVPGNAPAGVTNVQLHRVICNAGKEGIGLELRR